jgi:benzaldehyde dehydrogenase (NAD)
MIVSKTSKLRTLPRSAAPKPEQVPADAKTQPQPFDTDEEAIKLANDTEYGLSMAVVSSNVGRALKLGQRLRTGLLHINDQTVNDEVVNPFGGVGASGNGTSIGGPANWEEFTQWQWLTIKGEAPAYPI